MALLSPIVGAINAKQQLQEAKKEYADFREMLRQPKTNVSNHG
jgi:hypothetical protein